MLSAGSWPAERLASSPTQGGTMILSSLIPGLRTNGLNLAQTDTVYLHTPYRLPCQENGCGPNEAEGGGINPACPVCGRSGWTETLMPSVLKCRVRWWYRSEEH